MKRTSVNRSYFLLVFTGDERGVRIEGRERERGWKGLNGKGG